MVQKLTDDVFRSCLESGDYMQMKNALLVLNRCVKVGGRGCTHVMFTHEYVVISWRAATTCI